MENRIKLRKFGRTNKQREALMRSLAESLILNNKITTTQAKAKSLRPFIEKLITKGRTSNVHTIRLLSGTLGIRTAKKLVANVASRFQGQPGGYTRIRNLPSRQSDGSKMAVIEFIK